MVQMGHINTSKENKDTLVVAECLLACARSLVVVVYYEY